jgi:hypothetical protein
MSIAWLEDWEGALERARADKRSVFLFLHSPT